MNLFMFKETVKMASGALVANRMRSLLALLGIVVEAGSASVSNCT